MNQHLWKWTRANGSRIARHDCCCCEYSVNSSPPIGKRRCYDRMMLTSGNTHLCCWNWLLVYSCQSFWLISQKAALLWAYVIAS